MPLLDRVLIMSVNPGWGGQSFIPEALDKVHKVRRLLDAEGSQAALQVDGGVTPENAGDLVRAGAAELVAGSAVFKGDIEQNIQAFRNAIESALSA
jgi:ribulose-phosphate 3-epimerase